MCGFLWIFVYVCVVDFFKLLVLGPIPPASRFP